MKWNHHKPLLCYLEPIQGYYYPEFSLSRRVQRQIEYRIPNKAYRNFAFWINSFITNSAQTFIDIGGASESITQFRLSSRLLPQDYYVPTMPQQPAWGLSYGSSSSPHDITRYDLYSRHGAISFPWGFAFIEDTTTTTQLKTYVRYIFGAPSLACGEAGLYVQTYLGHKERRAYLLARVIISPAITKDYDTLHEEGWMIEFPSNYTRVLPYVLAYCGCHSATSPFMFRSIDGVSRRLRSEQPSAGSPDVRIGSDNTPPSPTDHDLRSPIASLSSQSHTVEIDTTLQECRIVRQGTYTPSTNVTLGEVGLFVNFLDDGGTARTFMIARGVFDPPVTLQAGITYTIGIVLRFG